VRVAVVTGAARGIGLGIARHLDARGHRVVLLDMDEGALAQAVDGLGPDALSFRCDVADEAAVAQTFERIVADCGTVDILVNNAGICPAHAGGAQPVEDISIDEWRRVIDVNLTGTFLCSRAAIPAMKRGGWGRIVNFSSMGGRMRSLLSGAHYGATKAGLIGFTRVLAGQLGPFGITANCIAPGRIDTAQSDDFGNMAPFLAQLPARRLGLPEDIAAGVEYLVSDAAGYVTGTVLDINGGHYMP
jgi:3-oxoacyl-[acyl-carrier protein] reductase